MTNKSMTHFIFKYLFIYNILILLDRIIKIKHYYQEIEAFIVEIN